MESEIAIQTQERPDSCFGDTEVGLLVTTVNIIEQKDAVHVFGRCFWRTSENPSSEQDPCHTSVEFIACLIYSDELYASGQAKRNWKC